MHSIGCGGGIEPSIPLGGMMTSLNEKGRLIGGLACIRLVAGAGFEPATFGL